MSGAIYIVGTPIGNLGDLTLRAIETLRRVEHVFAEDTRRTRALLSHLGIAGKKLHRFDAHSEAMRSEELLALVESGQEVALVTDAGMPLISDPGAELVRAAAERGLRVTVVPGPSAVTAALALSGLAAGSFLFVGFPPRQGEKRRALLERIRQTPVPVVLFEAANRARETLAELAESDPERPAAVCRELTKLHEQAVRGSLAELARIEQWRGELTIVLGALDEAASARASAAAAPDDAAIDARIAALLASGAPSKSIAQELALWSGKPRRELYARVQAVRDGKVSVKPNSP